MLADYKLRLADKKELQEKMSEIADLSMKELEKIAED